MDGKNVDWSLVALWVVVAIFALSLAFAFLPVIMCAVTATVEAIREQWPKLVAAFQ